MDLSTYDSEQRDQVYATLVQMYNSLVKSFEEMVDIKVNSRMVLKHKKYLELVKEEPPAELLDEDRIPFHVKLCLA